MVTLEVKIYPDGNQVCALIGENLQDGHVAFGDNPYQALRNLVNVLELGGYFLTGIK